MSADPERFASDGYAILSDSIDIDDDVPDWLLSEDVVGSVRVQAEDAEGGEVFLGLGADGGRPTRTSAASTTTVVARLRATTPSARATATWTAARRAPRRGTRHSGR